jgi:2-polyprenyl-3-methyl-5-hydroxy-6-metoxy-1,4-benzoquinol methylase
MSPVPWKKIAELTDQHRYMSGVRRNRDRVKKTGEVFTPTELVIEILKEMPIKSFAPGKTVCDPACGDGQFLVPVKLIKMLHFKMSEADALEDIYGVDIMRSNVDICKKRLGGGHILMGDTLNPHKRLPKQTAEEHRLMKEWFGAPTLERFIR